jgi:VWFA-related protein
VIGANHFPGVYKRLLSDAHLALLVAIVLAALSPVAVSGVRADGELTVSVREVNTDDSSAVQFLAKVVGQNGRPIPDLTPENFTLTVDGQAVPVTEVQTVTDAQVGISSLLVIDTSGSMEGTPLGAAREAASQYIRSLQPVDEVGVLAFANGVSVISEFSNDFDAVDASLGDLNALGNTALYDGVADAADRMATRENARRVVILLSDGEHFGPVTTTRDQALDAALSSEVPFYVIGLGPSIDADFLRELALSTGGAFFAAPSSDQLADLFDDIAALLRAEYVITADFSDTGLTGTTTGSFRAEAEQGNGEVSLTFSLPVVSATAVPPTPLPGVPQPVEPGAEPASGGNSLGTILVIVALLAVIGGGAWFYLSRRRRRTLELEYIPPVYGLPGDLSAGGRRTAPPATLRLESGEEFRIDGAATLGVDGDATYQLPLPRGEFGHGELRIWYANHRYVISDAALRPRIRVNGRSVKWSFLGEGDEIDIKGIKLRFRMSADVSSTATE